MAYIFARMIFFSTKPPSMYAPKCRGLYKQLDKNEYHIGWRIKGEKHNQDNIMPFKPSSKLFANTRNMWFLLRYCTEVSVLSENISFAVVPIRQYRHQKFIQDKFWVHTFCGLELDGDNSDWIRE